MKTHKNAAASAKQLTFLLTPLLLIASAGTGCEGDLLTPEERDVLQTMRLRPVPASLTNAVADNADAALLGQQFFFDRRFSGPLREGSDPSTGGLGPQGAAGLVSCATCHDPGRGGAD